MNVYKMNDCGGLHKRMSVAEMCRIRWERGVCSRPGVMNCSLGPAGNSGGKAILVSASIYHPKSVDAQLICCSDCREAVNTDSGGRSVDIGDLCLAVEPVQTLLRIVL